MAGRARDLPTAVADHTESLQLARGLRDAFAAHPQHVGDQFLGHFQLVRRQPVEREQQPAAKLLVDGMVSITHRGLGHLRNQRLRVAKEQVLQTAVAIKFFLDPLARQSICEPGALNDGRVRRRLAAHEKRDADRASLPRPRFLPLPRLQDI